MSLTRILVLAALVASPAFATASTPTGNRYALLVGINDYEHQKLSRLNFAVNDAAVLRDLLNEHGYQTILLADRESHDRSPTKANIEMHLRTLLEKCKRNDTIFVAFAGHGLQFEGQKDCFFCPSDARPFGARTETLVSLGKVYEDMDASFAGVKVLLVDACRDDPNAQRGARGLDGDTSPRPPRGVAALFSCSAGERAFEHEKFQHGVFFHHVIEGLRGRARDDEGEVTFAGLCNFVQRGVSRTVPVLIGGRAKQSPNLKADLSGASPVLVTVAPSTNTIATNHQAEELNQDWADYLKVLNKHKDTGVVDDFVRNRAAFRLSAWKAAAEQGHVSAQVLYGRAWQAGAGIGPNDEEAVRWFRRAGEQGFAAAEHALASMYKHGHGVPHDEDEASRWFRRAADRGFASSQVALAYRYWKGLGVPQDSVVAANWYRKAAEQGDGRGQSGMGWMYRTGQGVSQDDLEAVNWYRKAALQGIASAQHDLGWMYENGRGVTQNDVEAVDWYRKAAAQNYALSMTNLGSMYKNGRGVAQSDDEAVHWYRKAAEKGDARGQDNLGAMYENGRGVEKDITEAINWYRRAADQGNESARNALDRLKE